MHSKVPTTIKTIRTMKRNGEPFSSLTCYDATTAKWLERAGIHVLLVGDTAAEVILGFKRTIDMPLDVLIALTAGVKRGAPSCMVMADMPFMSYHADDASAIRNAGRFMTEGCADIVKIEADASLAPLIAKMARAGIPVCAHVGSKPQRAGLDGGYTAAGRTSEDAKQVVDDAVALEKAGAVMLLVEAIPDSVTSQIMEKTTVPVIGIGAGDQCDGQVLVLQDVLGLSESPPPFAHALASMGEDIQRAAQTWAQMVKERRVSKRSTSSRGASVVSPEVKQTKTHS
ncbi:MAG: 3-methyl-2-oxobutanoate hydroxymethyltransferase [Phycisphaerales bacterium]